MSVYKVMAAIFVGLVALESSPGAAQEAPTRSVLAGLSIGLHGSSVAVSAADGGTEFGGGMTFSLGYRFSDRFSIQSLTHGSLVAPSGLDHYFLTQTELDGRYTVSSRTRAWAPHFSVGVSTRTYHDNLSSEEEVGTPARTVLGLVAGVGVRYSFSPSAELDWSVRENFGSYGNSRCSDADEALRSCARNLRVSLGASWYPFAR